MSVARNDHTGEAIRSKRQNENFHGNFDKIFGKQPRNGYATRIEVKGWKAEGVKMELTEDGEGYQVKLL